MVMPGQWPNPQPKPQQRCQNNDESVPTASTKTSTCEAQQWICFSKVVDENSFFGILVVLRMEITNQVDHHDPKMHNCILSIWDNPTGSSTSRSSTSPPGEVISGTSCRMGVELVDPSSGQVNPFHLDQSIRTKINSFSGNYNDLI